MQTWTRPETKAELPPGPWHDEPDKAVWIDPATDLDCMIHRGPMGQLCGYVGVPPTHALHGYHYDQPIVVCRHEQPEIDHEHPMAETLAKLEELRKRDGKDFKTCWECPSPQGLFEVHGGLTYSNRCQPLEDESHGICHVPQADRPHDIWWFGFDCAHLGDLTPRLEAIMDEHKAADPTLSIDPYKTYKNIAYVQAEVTQLAEQIARFTP